MIMSLICGILLCFFVVGNAKYVVPPSLVEPLKPKGLRVSIPDEDGVTLMAFHGNINVPFEGLDAGEMSRDIIRKRGDRWVFEDKNVRLKKGDVIYYWIYVILDGLGYQGLDRNHTVTDFISDESSINRVGNDSVSGQKLVFDGTFIGDTIDSSVWFQEKKFGEYDDDEFVVFTSENSYLAQNKLEIKPSLLEERYSESFVRNGELNIEGCTSNQEDFCNKKAQFYLILPPVMSARVSTKNSFSFKYGTVEIKAKLPTGDWIVPELWLEPKESGNTGRIIIGLAHGNIDLKVNGNDAGVKMLRAGVIFDASRSQMLRKESATPWTNDFHVFKLVWSKSRLTFLIDNAEIGRIDSPDPNKDFVPFNKEYFITLGVHVGGIRDFPDTNDKKPWKNTSAKRANTFWLDRANWFSTWNRNSALVVEYVKVWAA